MKIKRIIALALALLMLWAIGCEKTGDKTPNKDTNNVENELNAENGGIKHSSIKLEEGEVVFRGRVTEIEKKAIMMEIVDSTIAFGTYRVNLSDSTPYFDKSGEAISKNDIKVGDVIEVVFGGQVAQSLPPQIGAIRVYIVE